MLINLIKSASKFTAKLAIAAALLCFSTVALGQLSTVTTANSSVCPGGSINLLTTPSGGTSYTYSWSPAGSLSNAAVANPVATPATTTKYFVTVTDVPTSATFLDSVTITVANVPPALEIVPNIDTICAGDSTQLEIFNSGICTTIPGSTCIGASSTGIVGTGTFGTSSQTISPYYKNYQVFPLFTIDNRSSKHQMIYTKDELNAIGLIGRRTISAIAFNVLTLPVGLTPYANFTIKMKCVTTSILSSTFETGMSTVFDPKTVTVVTGWNEHVFDNSFVWDGNSNIVVEVCFQDIATTTVTQSPIIEWTNGIGFGATNSSTSASACGATAGFAFVQQSRVNTRFRHCQAAHLSGLTYSWTPSAGLSSTTVHNPYAFPGVSTSYILTATDAGNCELIDTADIVVAPNFNLSVTADTVLCGEDSINLIATDNAGVGVTYSWSPASLVNNPSVASTKGLVNGNFTYQVNVKSTAGCEKTDSTVVSLYPPVDVEIVTPDTSICAGDTLQLESTTLNANCYTTVGYGCPSPTARIVGTGVGTFNIWSANPFNATASPFVTDPGHRKQILFTKAELNASGMDASTSITAIAFDVASFSGTATFNGFTVKMSCTSLDEFPLTGGSYETGLTTVMNATPVTISSGWVDLTFNSAFNWDGESNVVVEICWQNSSSLITGTQQVVNFTTLTKRMTLTSLLGFGGGAACTAVPSGSGLQRPNIRFKTCPAPPNLTFHYQWTPSIGLSDDTIPSPVVNGTVSNNYILTVFDAPSNCSDTDTVAITVAPNFALSAMNDTTLCNTDSFNLTLTHNSGLPVSYRWTPSSFLDDSTLASPLATIDKSYNVSVEVESNLGCIKRDTVDITLLNQVGFDISLLDTVACQDDSSQFIVDQHLKNGIAESALCASFNSATVGISSSASFSSNTTPFLHINPSTKRQYIMRANELASAGINSGQLSSIAINVLFLGNTTTFQNFTIKIGATTLDAFSTTAFVPGLETVLDPQNIVITAGWNTFVFDNLYNWDGKSNLIVELCYDNGTGGGFGNSSSVYYSNKTYTSSLFAAGVNQCGVSNGSMTSRRPNFMFNYCNYTPGAFSYSWSPTNFLSNPNIKEPGIILDSSRTYYLTSTDLTSLCAFLDSISFEARDFDVTALTDTGLCSTMDYQLDVVTDAVGPITYEWTPYPWVSDSSIANPVSVVSNGSFYSVRVTDSAGCFKYDTVDVDLYPNIFPSVTPDTTWCVNTDIVLQATGGDFYNWSPSNGLSNSTIPNPTATITMPITYVVNISNTFGCTGSDTVTIELHDSPLLDLGPDTSYCNGGWLTLDPGADFVAYEWQDLSTDQTFLVTNDGSFSVKTEDEFGCFQTDTVEIGIAPIPTTSFDFNTPLCVGDSLYLDAENPGATYLWSTGENSRFSLVKDSGMVWVEIDDGICVGRDTTRIVLTEYPVSELPELVTYCNRDNPFGVVVRAGDEQFRYKWSNNRVTNQIIADRDGMYTVSITKDLVCTIQDTVVIKYYCPGTFFVPTSFTPNSDGVNDYFSIAGSQVEDFLFEIYDRWGHAILRSQDPDFIWDGYFKGNPVQAGTYVWKLTYKVTELDGVVTEKQEYGNLHILR